MECWHRNTTFVWVLAALLMPMIGCRPAAEHPRRSNGSPVADTSTTSSEGSDAARSDLPAVNSAGRGQTQVIPDTVKPGSPRSAINESTLAFTEMKTALASEFRYSNGAAGGIHSIVETLGGGVALFDYDRDGVCDLFATGGGRFTRQQTLEGEPSCLWRGAGSFRFAPVTAGIESSRYFSHGCWTADFDNDGFGDLLVTGYGGLQLFHNQGDGTFIDVTDVTGLVDPAWSTGAAWGDFNRDGSMDLYVAHYVDWSFRTHRPCDDPDGGKNEICGPKHYEAVDDRLFLSRGDGTFQEATRTAGLRAGGKGLGVIVGDIDLDDDLDLYVANDTTDNFLYLNRGDGIFDEVGQLNGAALDDSGRPTGSMGVDLADFDGDGLPDLWTANYEHEIFGLYRNVGGGRFLHVSRPMGFAAIGDRFVGWGTGFADFDRDGDLDVIATTGHVKRFPATAPVKQEPLIWRNDQGRFIRQTFSSTDYLGSSHEGRGLALSDLDDDGDIDVVIAHNDRPIVVLSNETNRGDGDGWLRVQLIGTQSPRDAIGARLKLQVGSRTEWRQINGGGSYLSQSDLRPFWGIPEGAENGELEVRWPTGKVQVIRDLKPGSTIIVIEPDSSPGTTRSETASPTSPSSTPSSR